MSLSVRDEVEADHEAIAGLTGRAFDTTPHSDGSEVAIVERLRELGHMTLSLVASLDGAIVGHVAFSPVSVSDASGNWYGLGPISVEPERQKSGIGSALIKAGFERLRQLGAEGCVLVGDPAYYSRFGFSNDGRVQYLDVPSQYVQWVAFGSDLPAGELIYSPAFG